MDRRIFQYPSDNGEYAAPTRRKNQGQVLAEEREVKLYRFRNQGQLLAEQRQAKSSNFRNQGQILANQRSDNSSLFKNQGQILAEQRDSFNQFRNQGQILAAANDFISFENGKLANFKNQGQILNGNSGHSGAHDAIVRRNQGQLLEEGNTSKSTTHSGFRNQGMVLGEFAESQKEHVRTKHQSLQADASCFFDHTALKPDTTPADIDKLCKEAMEHNFYTVCVNSCFVKQAHERLHVDNKSDVKVCAVVGFPLGGMSSEAKAFEAYLCSLHGANEIDMVINVGMLKAGQDEEVFQDISAVVAVCKQFGMLCKVIIESASLSSEELERASHLAMMADADFIKTSTGFSATGGATVEAVRKMAQIAHSYGKQCKASGGIRDGVTAKQMIEAGADRLGTSATVMIVQDLHRPSHQTGHASYQKGGY